MRDLSSFGPFFRNALDRFIPASDGNIAIVFAVSMIPILGFVGTAVDYARVAKARTSMQVALDSAALMVSKDVAAGSLTTAQVTTRAQDYFTALYVNHQVTNIAVTATYSSGTSTVALTGQGNLATEFMKVIGFPNLTFTAATTTSWSSTAMRVALALDNTGSMAANGKMPAMQAAAKNLISKLSSAAASPGDVYVSLIPFAKDVNVGSSNYNQNWIDWTDWNSSNSTMVCDSYFLFICLH